VPRATMRSIGSEFEWTPLGGGPTHALPSQRLLFLLGRHAIEAAARECLGAGRRLWLPQYFCSHTADAISAARIPTATYLDHPLRGEPEWCSLRPSPGDAVLFVNYFGVRRQASFGAWQEEHNQIAVIEDHSHDPFSAWAYQSRAAFAIASLRKTVPIPDGGMLWSPAMRRLPSEPRPGTFTGSGLKLAAMIVKRDYLTSAADDEALFQAMRRLQTAGDEALSEESISSISPWSFEYVGHGVSTNLRVQREENVRLFVELAQRVISNSSDFRLGYTSWPEGHCPLNPLLVFRDEYTRNLCKNHLVGNRVYAPIHWPGQAGIPAADGGQEYLLTIPLDFRCSARDVRRVLDLLEAFTRRPH
jgi:hypothetical protein